MDTTFRLDQPDKQVELFGPADSHLRFLRKSLRVRLTAGDNGVRIVGPPEHVQRAIDVLEGMQRHLRENRELTDTDVQTLVGRDSKPMPSGKGIDVFSRGKTIRPSTQGQAAYLDAMLANDITFCMGPAGTGKTYLAVAVAVSMLKKKQIRRIVLARPAVEAGEKLGFLPGDLQAKVNPYLRPLFDALEDMMDFSLMRKYMDLDIIEIIPLAFMRGRTLNASAVICDEAQNTSALQMLMVLTRLGHGSKMIITGDVTQIDLDVSQKSGMIEAIDTLKDVDGIGVVALDRLDIVRHKLVQSIVRAYKDKKEKAMGGLGVGLKG